MSNNRITRAYAAMASVTIFIGLSYIFVKITLSITDVYTMLAHRFSIAALAVISYYLVKGKALPRLRQMHWKPLLLLSVFYPLLFFSLQSLGLNNTSAAEAGILAATNPILTAMLAYLFLREKSNMKQVGCIILSILGIVWILCSGSSGTSPSGTTWGSILILLSILAKVTYFILGRKYNPNYDAIDVTLFMTVLAAIFFNGVAVSQHLYHHNLSSYFSPFANIQFVWAILFLSILATFLSGFCDNYALSVLPASQVAIFNNLTPLVSVIGGILILHEHLYVYQIVGGALILFGVIGTSFFRTHRQITHKENSTHQSRDITKDKSA